MIRFISCVLTAAILLFSCEDTNVFILTDAGIDAVNALTLTDEEVQAIAARAAVSADSNHTVAGEDSLYHRRLDRLVGRFSQYDGHAYNFKVYLTEDVNAFAMADGTIRIYSGLMDLMNDQELLFVIGHEMGHVAEKHSRKKVVLAYGSSALRKGLASQENQIGEIARSTIGVLAERLAHAQFSQHEERRADDYGVMFLRLNGYTVDAAISALGKLEKLANEHTFLSSHPDPANRAARLEKEPWEDGEDTGDSIYDKIWNFIRLIIDFTLRLIKYVINVVLGLL